MGTQKNKIKSLFMSSILVIGCLLFFYLGYPILKSMPCPTAPDKIPNAPEEIVTVWPPPNSNISMGCYKNENPLRIPEAFETKQGVWIEAVASVRANLLISGIDPKKIPPFENRILLYVDGSEVAKTRDLIAGTGGLISIDSSGKEIPITTDEGGFYWIGSDPVLSVGNHLAKVVIVTTSGETIEYEWKFRIIW